MLQLAFSTKALRSVCENEERAIRELGAESAAALRRRLSDLRAADNVSDLIAGNPRQMPGSKEHLMLDLDAGRALVLAPNHTAVPRLGSGAVDWSKVSRVKVLRIETDNG